MEKRSLSLGGHRTSASLEPAFWAEFERIAKADGVSLAGLAFQIDRERMELADPPNLSSALRLFILERLKSEARP